jgi:hypothetical protein
MGFDYGRLPTTMWGRAWRGATAGALAGLTAIAFGAPWTGCPEGDPCTPDRALPILIAGVLFPIVGGGAAAALGLDRVWLFTTLASDESRRVTTQLFRRSDRPLNCDTLRGFDRRHGDDVALRRGGPEPVGVRRRRAVGRRRLRR